MAPSGIFPCSTGTLMRGGVRVVGVLNSPACRILIELFELGGANCSRRGGLGAGVMACLIGGTAGGGAMATGARLTIGAGTPGGGGSVLVGAIADPALVTGFEP